MAFQFILFCFTFDDFTLEILGKESMGYQVMNMFHYPFSRFQFPHVPFFKCFISHWFHIPIVTSFSKCFNFQMFYFPSVFHSFHFHFDRFLIKVVENLCLVPFDLTLPQTHVTHKIFVPRNGVTTLLLGLVYPSDLTRPANWWHIGLLVVIILFVVWIQQRKRIKRRRLLATLFLYFIIDACVSLMVC